MMEYADHEDFKPSTLGELQAIYRWISTHAHCFIIEVEGYSVGECWLQRMNLRRIVDSVSWEGPPAYRSDDRQEGALGPRLRH